MKSISTFNGDYVMPLLAMITLTGMSGTTKDITKRFDCMDCLEVYMSGLDDKNLRGSVTGTSLYNIPTPRTRNRKVE